MGLFSALLKLLGKTVKSSSETETATLPLRCKSPYFLPQLFCGLKSLVGDYSVLGQNQMPAKDYEELLLARIQRIEQLVVPPLEEVVNQNLQELEDMAGMSILEATEQVGEVEGGTITAAATEEEKVEAAVGVVVVVDKKNKQQKGKRKRRSADLWPLFRSGKRRAIDDQTTAEKETAEEEDDELSLLLPYPGDLSDPAEWSKHWQPLSSTPAKKQVTEQRETIDLSAIECCDNNENNSNNNNINCDEDLNDVSLLSDLPDDLSVDPSLANIAWQDIEVEVSALEGK
jgi:hypothetical protein